MYKNAKVVARNRAGELFILGEVKVRIEPRYANGRIFIRNLIKYDSNLILSKKVNEEELRKDIGQRKIIEVYFVSEYEEIRRFMVILENTPTLSMRKYSDYARVSEDETKEILNKLNE